MSDFIWLFLNILCVIYTLCESQNVCNETTVTQIETECVPCSLAEKTTCPTHIEGLTEVSLRRDCYYFTGPILPQDDLDPPERGCNHRCTYNDVYFKCCSGYWGIDCLECPGGATGPCGGHGICDDGAAGNGTCTCEDKFKGIDCAQCQDRHYGNDCSSVCDCDQGVCNSGRHGDGSCECLSGYGGLRCEKELPKCDQMQCDENYRCIEIDGEAECICERGFTLQNFECTPIDNCQVLSPCFPNATCLVTGPGTHSCTCPEGYLGDGLVCEAIDPCQYNFGGCLPESSDCVYISPGISSCKCLDGFEKVYTSDSACQLIDFCVGHPELCGMHATCTMVQPTLHQCVCPRGYIGDGFACYGSIVERIKELNDPGGDLSGQLDTILDLFDEVQTKEVFGTRGPFTLFVPTENALALALSKSQILSLTNSDVSKRHRFMAALTIPVSVSLNQLTNGSVYYTADGLAVQFSSKDTQVLQYTQYNVAGDRSMTTPITVQRGDVLAVNGIIHVLDIMIPPFLPSDPTRSTRQMIADENIKFYQLIQRAEELMADTEFLSGPGPYTVLLPTLDAMEAIPLSDVQYLTSSQGIGKLMSILETHILTGTMLDALDLTAAHRLMMTSGISLTVRVGDTGRMEVERQAQVLKAGMAATDGVIHMISSLVIPDALRPILSGRCDKKRVHQVKGICGPCDTQLHCSNPDDKPTGNTVTGCIFVTHLTGGLETRAGCQIVCNHTTSEDRCCDGYYGNDCMSCPGMPNDLPCYGRGKCFDGLSGNGSCECSPSYTGVGCELCTNDTMYGAHCNKECSCLYGVCDNRVRNSDGSCKMGSCQNEFVGINCEQRTTPCVTGIKRRRQLTSVKCHANAVCVSDTSLQQSHLQIRRNRQSRRWLHKQVKKYARKFARKGKERYAMGCQCRDGYDGDGITRCDQIDPCLQEDRGGCHEQAKCTSVSPGNVQCDCNPGFTGDGLFCFLASSCTDAVHCGENAHCQNSSPQGVCVCHVNYEGDGRVCLASNLCNHDNGGCDVNAECRSVGPGKANCSCSSGYIGDGYTCYGAIPVEVKNQHLTQLEGLLQGLDERDDILYDLESEYTLLAPSDAAIASFLKTERADFWTSVEAKILLLSYHILPDKVSITDLNTTFAGTSVMTLAEDDNDEPFALNISTNNSGLYLNGGVVIKGDIPAANGFIHIIDKVLEPHHVTLQRPPLAQALAITPKLGSFYDQLERFGMLEKIEQLPSYTIFAPVDIHMTERMLWQHVVEGQDLPLSALQNGMILHNILENSLQHRINITKTSPFDVQVNGIPVRIPNIRTLGGTVHGINGKLFTDNNKCDKVTTYTVMGECVSCKEEMPCPRGYKPTIPEYSTDCEYTHPSRLVVAPTSGCQRKCYRENTVPECCDGFYGPLCKACPGGSETPCNLHGLCSQSLRGTGECRCYSGYMNSQCQTCPAGASCVTDLCQLNNGGCDINAECTFDGKSGSRQCMCKQGYFGTGYRCTSRCTRDNGGCGVHAMCTTEASGVNCKCPAGYVHYGASCRPDSDACDIDNGNCSVNAQCTLLNDTDMTDVFCECKDGFGGDGLTCNPSIYNTLSSLPELSMFTKLLSEAEDIKSILLNTSKSLTLFVPQNHEGSQVMEAEAVKRYLLLDRVLRLTETSDVSSAVLSTFISADGTLLTISREDLPSGQVLYLVNGIVVTQPNIPAVNGVIHGIRQSFTTQSTQSSLHQYGMQFATSAAAVLLTLLVVAVGWVIYRRGFTLKKMKYWQNSYDVDQPGTVHYDTASSDQPTDQKITIMQFSNPMFAADN